MFNDFLICYIHKTSMISSKYCVGISGETSVIIKMSVMKDSILYFPCLLCHLYWFFKTLKQVGHYLWIPATQSTFFTLLNCHFMAWKCVLWPIKMIKPCSLRNICLRYAWNCFGRKHWYSLMMTNRKDKKRTLEWWLRSALFHWALCMI